MRKALKAVLAVVVLAGAAAGISYATTAMTRTDTSTLQACANNTNGNLRLVSSPADCRTNESAVSWNVVGPTGPQGPQGVQGPPGPQGPPGKDGVDGKNGLDGKNGVDGKNGIDGTNGIDGASPVVTQLTVPDPNCPTGGVSIADGLGHIGYVCNGAKGLTGDTGPAGQFSGIFKSPNGAFTITVDNTGIKLQGPTATVAIDPVSLLLSSDSTAKLQAAAGLTLDGGPITKVNGSLVQLGSASCSPAIRETDLAGSQVIVAGAGAFPVLYPSNGSPTVCVG